MKIDLTQKYDFLSNSWKIENASLADISQNKNIILYFYPADNTPGCTTENKDFTCLKQDFIKLWYLPVWISKNSIESHKNFREKQGLDIDLITDSELTLHKALWVYGEKNNYWKKVMWVIRSTFIIDKAWEIVKEYRNIKATWHAERLLKELKN